MSTLFSKQVRWTKNLEISQKVPSTRLSTTFALPTASQFNMLHMFCRRTSWKPKLKLSPGEPKIGATSILLFDDYKVHKTPNVRARFEELGVSTYSLPGDVTSLHNQSMLGSESLSRIDNGDNSEHGGQTWEQTGLPWQSHPGRYNKAGPLLH